MRVAGCTALITGANRGLGKAFTEAFLSAGAAKVYAGARDPSALTAARVIPVRLDVVDPGSVAAAAARCGDVDVLVNNAGIMLDTGILADGAEQALRREMEVNVFGVLATVRAFAPILARNGGGAIVNVLSVVSLFVNPSNATYCVTKHAALAVTDAVRMELRAHGTRVTAVYAGYIDTDMAAGIDAPKTSAREVAERTIDGLRAGAEHVLAGASAQRQWAAHRPGIPAFGSAAGA